MYATNEYFHETVGQYFDVDVRDFGLQFLEGLRPYEDGEDDTLRDMFLNGEIPDCPAKRYQKLCPLTGKEVTAWQLLSDDWFHLLKSSPSSNAIKNKFNSQYNESNRKPRRRDPPAGGSDNLTSKRRKLESPNGQAKAGLKVQAAPDGSATNVYFQDSDGSSQAGRAATHFEANASDEDIQTGAGFGLHASSSAEDAGEQDEVDSCSLTLGISEALNTSTPALSSLDEVDITIRGQVYHPLTNVRKPLPRFGGENTLMVQPLGTAACCSPSPFKTVYSEDNPMSASPDGIRQQTQSHLVPPRRSRISPRFFGYSDDEEGVSQNAMMASPSPAAARDDESSFLDPLLEEPSSEEAELLGRHMSVSRLTY